MGPIGGDPDVEYVVAAELRLLDPAVRGSRAESAALLDPGFREFGASGRVWDRDSILDMMSAETAPPPSADGLAATRLGPDAILVTYRTRGATRTALRSSVWLRRQGRWRLYFHQGTPQP